MADPASECLSDVLDDRVLSFSQGWGELGIDTCAHAPGLEPLPLRIKDQLYEKGLGTHAPGEIILDLNAEFEALEADIGVQWQQGDTGTVVFQVFVDGEKRFDSGVVTERHVARQITVPVKGADELRLVVTDAGDGITCDCANWVNARLIRDPSAAQRPPRERFDAAPFARVVTLDPNRMDGCRASRIEEFPADEVYLATDVLPNDDGAYGVPTAGDGRGCIGLEWVERRFLKELAIEFTDARQMPTVDQAEAQYWAGESRWQGQWKPIEGEFEKHEERWLLRPDWANDPETSRRGVQKVRWVFDATGHAITLRRLSAFTRSRWDTIDLLLDQHKPQAGQEAEIEVYNGAFPSAALRAGLEPEGPGGDLRRTWDLSGPLRIKVRYTKPRAMKSDQTVLRFHSPAGSFTVAVHDILEHGCVYLPYFGVYVAQEPGGMPLAQYRQQISDRQTVLERVRRMPDQTFAQALAQVHRPIQDNGPTMLSLPGDNRKFVVDRDGTFGPYQEGRPHPSYAFRVTPRFGSGASPMGTGTGGAVSVGGVIGAGGATRHLARGWLPAPAITAQEDGVTYTQLTFVLPAVGGAFWPASEAAPAASSPWWHSRPLFVAEFAMQNTEPNDAPASLALDFATDEGSQLEGLELAVGRGFHAPPGAGWDPRPTGPGLAPDPEESGVVLHYGEKLLAYVDTAAAAPLEVRVTVGATGRSPLRVLCSGELPRRATARLRMYIPGWEAEVGERSALGEEAPTLDDLEAYWCGVLEPAMQVEIPEPLLQNVIRASQVYCLMAARNEDQGARIAPWIASDRYGPLESEGHSIVLGMDLFGHHDFARRCLDFYIRRYNDAGFLTTGYTLMGTGWHLWTLGDHYLLTHDTEWLEANASEVARVCRWIAQQRKKTEKLDARGEKTPEYGLMPPGVVADWGRYAYRFFMEGHFCAGLLAAARALADVGDPEAHALLEEATEFREDLLRAYRWAQARTPAVPLSDGTFAPGIPPMLYCFGPAGEFFPGEDGNRSWAGDVETGTHHLVALGLMDPASEDAEWMTQILEDHWCLHEGLFEYPGEESQADWFNLGGFSKLQPYYTRLTDLHALRDDVKPFIRSYFNAIPSLLNQENLSVWEHFHNAGAWNKTHETGWFLQQTRTMFLMERGPAASSGSPSPSAGPSRAGPRGGQELWLAPFVTNNWLQDGMTVSIANAPTQFGPVGYRITSHVQDGFIEAAIEPPTRSLPQAIVIRLRHPEGKRIRAVTVNGRPHADFDAEAECIRLRASTEPIAVRAEY